MILWGRVAMNRHYSVRYCGGSLTSKFAASHPGWYEVTREGGADPSRLCYAFPEVRRERVAILSEITRIGVYGLQLDFCRQPPIIRYHPVLVEGYRKKMGIDPRGIEGLDREACLSWWRFRAEFVTQFMRELKSAIDEIRRERGRPIPVQARICDSGFDINLAAGLDVVTWCREGLIDELCVNPLHWAYEGIVHDVRPYVELCRRTGIRILGGAHTNCIDPVGDAGINPVVLARRVLDLYRQGVEGVVLYETEYGVEREELADLLPIVGNPEALEEYLSDSERLACWPSTYKNAFYGIDNHSGMDWSIYYLWTGEPRL